MNHKTNRRPSKSHTIAEIAARAGVSIQTVSRVLNNRPDVAPGTRERVEQIIQESGFVHSRLTPALRKGSSGIVDIIVPGLDTLYSVEIVRGVEEVIDRTELRLALSTMALSTTSILLILYIFCETIRLNTTFYLFTACRTLSTL